MIDQTIPLKWVKRGNSWVILRDDKPLLKAKENGWWGIYINGGLIRQGRKNNLEDAQAAAVRIYNTYFSELPRVG